MKSGKASVAHKNESYESTQASWRPESFTNLARTKTILITTISMRKLSGVHFQNMHEYVIYLAE